MSQLPPYFVRKAHAEEMEKCPRILQNVSNILEVVPSFLLADSKPVLFMISTLGVFLSVKTCYCETCYSKAVLHAQEYTDTQTHAHKVRLVARQYKKAAPLVCESRVGAPATRPHSKRMGFVRSWRRCSV